MTKEQLKIALAELIINPNYYSLDGDLIPDRMVICKSYNDWQVFYFDEKGNRRNEQVFHSESEAYQYLYDSFKNQYKK